MLISGELYIEFKDQAVKQSKIKSMMKSISSHLGGDRATNEDTSSGVENTTAQASSESKIVTCLLANRGKSRWSLQILEKSG